VTVTARAEIVSIGVRPLATGAPVQLIRLALESPFEFDAGQYLEVVHPDGTPIPLSIASAPEALPNLEIHYRSTPGLKEAERMDELLAVGRPLTLRGPGGSVRLRPDDASSLLLIASGTGTAQALSLIRAQTARHPDSSVLLLACAETRSGFYFRDLLPVSTRVTTMLSADPSRDEGNIALRWLTRQPPPGRHVRTILCGAPAFVHSATAVLVAGGWTRDSLESDVYDYAPA
jgi:NAD(P)H-flavin reductase